MKINLKSRLTFLFVFLFLIMFLFGSIGEAKPYTFYLVLHGGGGDPFFASVMQGWETACKQLGVKGIYLAPLKFSIPEMVDMLESAISAKPDGIGTAILSDEAFRPTLERAKQLGIPVVAVNVEDYEPPYVPYLSYVGQDEFIVGKILANRALEEFTPKRAVVGIHFPGLLCHELRAKGIMDVFKEKGIPIEKIDITAEPTQAIEILRNYIKRYPDTDAIFTLGPLGAHPAIDLAKEENLKGKVRIATCDVSEKILTAIKEGYMITAIAQQPFMQGYFTALWLYLNVEYGFIPPPKLQTGPTVIDINNVDTATKQVEKTGSI